MTKSKENFWAEYVSSCIARAEYLETKGYSAKIDVTGCLTIENKDDTEHEVWGFFFDDWQVDDLFNQCIPRELRDESEPVKLAIILCQAQDW